MKVIITFTFCCDNLWKSKFMALEDWKTQGIFSPTFCLCSTLIGMAGALCVWVIHP